MEANLRVISRNTVVVGTGAAGLNAASRLIQYGQRDIAVVTEGVNAGTSRNAGSDKQTYYKLTLSGGEPDSPLDMARTLFEGQCVDGDNALCEAALSAQSFLRLAELGVPFPRSRYGEFVGYKTDHDPRRRAASAGPYTSREMTRALEADVREKGAEIFDRMQVVRVLTDGDAVCGLLCLNLDAADDPENRFTAFCCKNIIYATGGPAGMYLQSVYPLGHFGATGAAFRAGAKGQNLTEWQYGLSSLSPRWNVSGTYMQALPRFISTDAQGGGAREFLRDFFRDEGELLSRVFLKGYQWPFDARKVEGGSSVIDLLAHRETARGRRVWLDFTANPGGGEIDFSRLSPEARDYLNKAGACFGAPIDRLRRMNAPAVEFYRERGVDLAREPLEIALCAQHNNGGLAVDCWWQTRVRGLYAVGEAAGTHGVYRPGGSALNAGQAGSTRAALRVARLGRGEPDERSFARALDGALSEVKELCRAALRGGDNVKTLWEEAAGRMSRFGGAIRSREGVEDALNAVKAERAGFAENVRVPDARGLSDLFRLEDALLCQQVYLSAMLDYMDAGGGSRGSALYEDPRGDTRYQGLPEGFAFTLDDGSRAGWVQETALEGDEAVCRWRRVRPIPSEDDFFENVWRSYRENGNVF